jgi:hypothetical protein
LNNNFYCVLVLETSQYKTACGGGYNIHISSGKTLRNGNLFPKIRR